MPVKKGKTKSSGKGKKGKGKGKKKKARWATCNLINAHHQFSIGPLKTILKR